MQLNILTPKKVEQEGIHRLEGKEENIRPNRIKNVIFTNVTHHA